MSAALVQAKLRWEAACERLRFALDRPKGAIGEGPDAAAAFDLVHSALAELQTLLESPPAKGPPEAGDEP